VFISAGARYTYAEVPLPDWVDGILGASRNSFDRVGHFVQGLTVCLLAREILSRRTTLGRRCGLPVLSVAFALAFSAAYELVEWWTVLAFYPDEGPGWLGMQGDPWDAQQDMLMALLGALATATLLAPLHDRSMGQLLRHS
jgi:putative membrane protein